MISLKVEACCRKHHENTQRLPSPSQSIFFFFTMYEVSAFQMQCDQCSRNVPKKLTSEYQFLFIELLLTCAYEAIIKIM